MSDVVDRYSTMLNEARSLGYSPGLRALRELYGEAGQIIHELQKEIDALRARDKKRGGE